MLENEQKQGSADSLNLYPWLARRDKEQQGETAGAGTVTKNSSLIRSTYPDAEVCGFSSVPV